MAGSDRTQTGSGCNTPGCKPWTAGLWPTITGDGRSVNGGVPQNASLAAHVAALKATVVTWIPDAGWTGNAVFDFEAWTPVWEQNIGSDSWHSKRYQDASIAIVKAQHPTWNSTAVQAEAKKQFETAALQWMVTTLNTVTALRPKARWGYYGIPQGYAEPCAAPSSQTAPLCGYRCPILGDVWRAQNDRMQPLFDASTAMFPSIYLPPQRSPDYTARNLDYVQGTIQEAQRLAKKGQPTLPFAWAMYHDQSSLLLPDDLNAELAGPALLGLEGVVLWGDPPAFKDAAAYDKYLDATLGPMALKVHNDACACATAHCSGHGRCVNNTSPCVCDAGYTGATCSSHAV